MFFLFVCLLSLFLTFCFYFSIFWWLLEDGQAYGFFASAHLKTWESSEKESAYWFWSSAVQCSSLFEDSNSGDECRRKLECQKFFPSVLCFREWNYCLSLLSECCYSIIASVRVRFLLSATFCLFIGNSSLWFTGEVQTGSFSGKRVSFGTNG